MNKHRWLMSSVPAIFILMTLFACGGSTPPSQRTQPRPTLTPQPQPQSAGTVSHVEDVVEHGDNREALDPLTNNNSRDLFAGDFLQVSDNGEARLDFGDGMLVRLFNDSSASLTRAEAAPNTSLNIRLALEAGGMTGDVEEGELIITTIGGAEITILGTQFFVVYDSAGQRTIVGNFNGSVVVESGGSQLALNSGEAVIVPDNQPPGSPFPFSSSMSDFERKARSSNSPQAAAEQILDEEDGATETPPDTPPDIPARTLFTYVDGAIDSFDLAASIDSSDDGLSQTFFLREDVLMEDGNPFDASIVQKALEDWPPVRDQAVSIEIVDDYTIVMTMEIVASGELTLEEFFDVYKFWESLASIEFITQK